MPGTPYLETSTVVDALKVRDHLARVMKRAGAGNQVTIEIGRRVAEHLIREGLIDIRAVEISMAEENVIEERD
jgi:hypothetical protein